MHSVKRGPSETRTYISGSNEQKKPKITAPCSLCRKTCHPINGDETLKNMHNKKKTRKLDGGNCRTANIACTARSKVQNYIYISKIGEELRERFNKHITNESFIESLSTLLRQMQKFSLISRWRYFQRRHHFQCIFWKFDLPKIRWNFFILHSSSTFDILVKNMVLKLCKL